MKQACKEKSVLDVRLGLVICVVLTHLACDDEDNIAALEVMSSAFVDDATIPIKHTCDGIGISPPLLIVGTPMEAKSVAITVEDPDTLLNVTTHWILWGIPPRSSILLVEDYATSLDEGVVQGKNSGDEIGYMAVCPPAGEEHRYFFNAYALDIELDLSEKTSPAQLAAAMKGHIVGKGQLLGRYKH